ESFDVVLTARDAEQNTKTDYTGAKSVAWTWASGGTESPKHTAALKPATGDQGFTAGITGAIGGFRLTKAAESTTIRATADEKTGTTAAVTATPGALADFTLTTQHSGTETAGTAFSVTATGRDGEENIKTDYTDGKAVAWVWDATSSPNSTAPTKPANATETFSAGAMTKAGFTLTNSSETPVITITADSASGSTAAITVKHGAAASFTVIPSDLMPTTAETIDVAVTAKDASGNTADGANGATAFTGIVFLTTNATAPIWYNQVGNITASGTKTFEASVKFPTAEDDVTITAENSGATVSGTSANINVSAAADTTAPVLTNIQATAITTTGATITWNTDEIASSTVEYGTTSSYGAASSSDSLVKPHSIVLTGLTAGTQYHFRVKSTDGSSNTATSVDGTFVTTAAAGDGDAPAGLAITTADATVNSDYYTIGGTITADPNNVTIQVLNGSAVAGTVIITTGDTDWSAVVALPQNATTTFMARATDPSGNSALSTANATPGLQDVVIIEDENVGADGTAPLFVAQAPAAGTTGVSISPDNFYVSFDEALDPNTIGSSTVKLCLVSDESCTNPVDIGSPMLMEQGKMIRLGGPSVTLSYNTPYWIYVTAGVADLADNHIIAHGSTTTSQFTTETAPVGSFMTDAPVMVKTSGAANNSYPDGWEWVMTVTLPTNLNHTALKFGNWASGSNSLAAGDNMQYYSEQIADDDTGGLNHPIAITAADTYPTNLTITNDADSSRPGIQTNIHIQVKLPSSTPAGSYSTSYGVRAQ
ncbi:MAG: fibronectin type III domain-containing protein, partial [Patescibacteria group bacterium]